MFAVTVEFELAADGRDAFLPLVTENARASRDEPSCLRFDVLTDPERPGEVFLYELYVDAAAFDAHRATDHFARFDAASRPLVRAKRVRSWAGVAE
jgi:autoinducer 2-degrading protein